MPTDQLDLLEKLYAHRAALEQLVEAAEAVGDQQSLELNRVLIRQCDNLIEMAEERARRKDQTPWLIGRRY